MQAINLDFYSLSRLTAKEDVLNPRSSINWALFAYDGITNNLKLSDSGADDVSDLAGRFYPSRPLCGLCRVGTEGTGHCIVLIAWVSYGSQSNNF
uniref:ADF-H domain-containing protein n=1 Tax=Hucho hucho TaxID=62062 RepID=A0A4W5QV37_9TELE